LLFPIELSNVSTKITLYGSLKRLLYGVLSISKVFPTHTFEYLERKHSNSCEKHTSQD
jgi:hypothetical protein